MIPGVTGRRLSCSALFYFPGRFPQGQDGEEFRGPASVDGVQFTIDYINLVGVLPRSLFRKFRLVSKWNFFGLFRPTAMVDTLAPQRAVVRSTMVTFAKSPRQ
ncbi:MAG: hypothetical protein QOH78_1678 [Verrucomicrobiota bacterium]